eukprot:scaffold22015_cov78-Phaeocystis_antarctica.AAC.6
MSATEPLGVVALASASMSRVRKKPLVNGNLRTGHRSNKACRDEELIECVEHATSVARLDRGQHQSNPALVAVECESNERADGVEQPEHATLPQARVHHFVRADTELRVDLHRGIRHAKVGGGTYARATAALRWRIYAGRTTWNTKLPRIFNVSDLNCFTTISPPFSRFLI